MFVPPSTKPTKESYWLYVYWTAARVSWLDKQAPKIVFVLLVTWISTLTIHYNHYPNRLCQRLVFITLYKSLISRFISAVISLTGMLYRPDDDIHKKSTVTDSHLSDNYCIKSYFNYSASTPSTSYRTVLNMANIDRLLFIAELSSGSELSSVEKANQYCGYLRTVLDKHAPLLCGKLLITTQPHGLSQ